MELTSLTHTHTPECFNPPPSFLPSPLPLSVRFHTAACQCPPGLIGAPDPTVSCVHPPEPHFNTTVECYYDSDCADGLACLEGGGGVGAVGGVRPKCLDPCYELRPCHASAICSVRNTVPFRTMICSCECFKLKNHSS